MNTQSILINQSPFGSLSKCKCGMFHFCYNQLNWIFSYEELEILKKTLKNIIFKHWIYSIQKETWLIKIPIFFEEKKIHLLCNRKEFDNLNFIINGYKIDKVKTIPNNDIIHLN